MHLYTYPAILYTEECMIRPISATTSFLYKQVFKPVLFRIPPDKVHINLVKFGKLVGKVAILRWLIKTCFSYENDTFLRQEIAGITYKNPVGLSAGFDKNFELLKVLPSVGFGFIEGGSLTFHKSPGNPRPHYRRLPKSKSILVHAGLNNDGVKIISKRITSYGSISIPLNISVAKTNAKSANTDDSAVADYIASLQIIKQQKVGDIITLNISCPNAFGGEPFTTAERLRKLLDKVDALKLNLPIYIKMPIDKPWEDFKPLLDVAIAHNITGVTIGNLAKNRDNDAIKDAIKDEWPGNMSGEPTEKLSNELIRQTYAYCGDKLIIVGVGGIFDAVDAYEKIKLGASLVELITGVIYQGPQVIGQIVRGLENLARADGHKHISDAIGSHHKS